MANLRETQTWENGIYQIEKTDPVVGGADGISNKQAKQLANRTAYLKQQVESKANKTDLTNGLNGKANSSHTHAWGEITGKPSTFTPASHTHTMANITDLATAMNAKANASHTHTMANITDLAAAMNAKANASHTHTMANITDLAAAMNAKANLANPTFTGAPKAPTPAQTVNDTTIATTAFVKAAIAALVGSAPEALDTLEELSNALANDANLKKTLLTEIGKKANASHNHTMGQITDFELKNLSTEDLDTIKKAGMYGQQANANATTARHYPEAVAGALLVLPSAYGWMQIYIAHSTYRIYIRNANNSGGWASWVRMDAVGLFTQSFNDNGWIKFPNGMIRQWGRVKVTTSMNDSGHGGHFLGISTVTFPLAVNKVLNVSGALFDPTNSRCWLTEFANLNSTGMQITAKSTIKSQVIEVFYTVEGVI